MSDPGSASRPARGLPPEEALERWSDLAAYAAMREYWDARSEGLVIIVPSTPPSARYEAYRKLRRPLEEQFHARLRDGELLVSAMAKNPDPTSARTLIDPEEFRRCKIAWDTLVGPVLSGPLSMDSLEIFEPPGIPRNVRVVQQWYWDIYEPDQGRPTGSAPGRLRAEDEIAGFHHHAGYRHVRIDGVGFMLTRTQANIVRQLHEAHLQGDDPWRYGPTLLGNARSNSMQLFQVFRRHTDPHWSILIESNGRGWYRLNIRA